MPEAKDYFISFIKRHPDDPEAYVLLYGCADSATLPDIISSFQSVPVQAGRELRLILGNLYQLASRPDLAEAVNDSIISGNPNTALAVKAETNNMLIDLYDNNDLQGAEELLSRIETQASLISPMELQDAQEAVALHGGAAAAGSEKVTSVASSSLPKSFGLLQNYPNPFNPTTFIQYQLPKDTRVTLKIYDILGREVATLVDGRQTAGYHEVEFDGSRFASGVYFYRLTTPTYSKVQKMILMK